MDRVKTIREELAALLRNPPLGDRREWSEKCDRYVKELSQLTLVKVKVQVDGVSVYYPKGPGMQVEGPVTLTFYRSNRVAGRATTPDQVDAQMASSIDYGLRLRYVDSVSVAWTSTKVISEEPYT